MTGIIVKSKIREVVKKLDEEGIIGNVSEEVEVELEKKVEEILKNSIKIYFS